MLVKSINADVNIIQQAIDSYIADHNKSRLCNWQLLHRYTAEQEKLELFSKWLADVERAEILSKWLHIAAYSQEQLNAFLYNFMYVKSVSNLSSQLLNIAYKTQSKFVDISTIKKEAKILIGGCNTTGFLRAYIKKAYDSISVGSRYIQRTKFDDFFTS